MMIVCLDSGIIVVVRRILQNLTDVYRVKESGIPQHLWTLPGMRNMTKRGTDRQEIYSQAHLS